MFDREISKKFKALRAMKPSEEKDCEFSQVCRELFATNNVHEEGVADEMWMRYNYVASYVYARKLFSVDPTIRDIVHILSLPFRSVPDEVDCDTETYMYTSTVCARSNNTTKKRWYRVSEESLGSTPYEYRLVTIDRGYHGRANGKLYPDFHVIFPGV